MLPGNRVFADVIKAPNWFTLASSKERWKGKKKKRDRDEMKKKGGGEKRGNIYFEKSRTCS